MREKIYLIGGGGFCREFMTYFDYEIPIAGIIDEKMNVETLRGFKVHKEFRGLTGSRFYITVGDPQLRAKLFEKALEFGMLPAMPASKLRAGGREIQLGMGTIVCPGSVLTTDIKIEDNVLINLNCTVGHDVYIGEHCVLAPGVNISGNTYVARRTNIGTNACIREGTKIGADATIGMGAVVVKDVMSGFTVVGNPAKPLPRN